MDSEFLRDVEIYGRTYSIWIWSREKMADHDYPNLRVNPDGHEILIRRGTAKNIAIRLAIAIELTGQLERQLDRSDRCSLN